MGRFSLRLPKTLHQELEILADQEGISINQYIVYALTQKVTAEKLALSPESLTKKQAALLANLRLIPAEEVAAEADAFEALLTRLGQPASDEAVEQYLSEREPVEPESELDREAVRLFKERLK